MSDVASNGDTIDPMVEAQAELSANLVVTPDDLFQGLSPNAVLYYLQQAAYTAMARWAEQLDTDANLAEYEDTDVTKTFYGITAVCGMLDEACVLVGILPPEALDEPTSE